MPLRRPCPKGQCKQCWRHAYDPDVHRKQRGDCPPCVDHMVNGCPPDQIQQ
jgi:hypothetical protein